jgi:hypothetical protein
MSTKEVVTELGGVHHVVHEKKKAVHVEIMGILSFLKSLFSNTQVLTISKSYSSAIANNYVLFPVG